MHSSTRVWGTKGEIIIQGTSRFSLQPQTEWSLQYFCAYWPCCRKAQLWKLPLWDPGRSKTIQSIWRGTIYVRQSQMFVTFMGSILMNDLQWFLLSGITPRSSTNKEKKIRAALTWMDPSALVSIQVSYEFDECGSPWIVIHLGNRMESDFLSCINVIGRDGPMLWSWTLWVWILAPLFLPWETLAKFPYFSVPQSAHL